MAIKIIVDSASDISKNEAESLGITMIPMLVTFDGEDFYDGIDLSPQRFYEKLIESDTLPKTSQITAFRFEEEIDKVLGDDDEAIVITLSSKLSGTYGEAVKASQKYGGRVRIFDSLNVAVGERLLCLVALDLIKKGLKLDEVVEKLKDYGERLQIMAVVDTLEYLKKGGRISSTVAFAGSLLSIKPVVAVENGEVKMVGKAMGSKRSNNLLNQLVIQKGGIDFSLPFGVLWSGLDKTTLEKYVKDSAHLWSEEVDSVPEYQIGGTIGTHVGPGAVGVAFFSKNK